MFRSALASALRYLLRGKLYAAISVFGLAVGLSMALLAALFIRSEYSNEHFIAGYQDLYLATTITTIPGRSRHNSTQTPQMLAALIKERFPHVVNNHMLRNHLAASFRPLARNRLQAALVPVAVVRTHALRAARTRPLTALGPEWPTGISRAA